jgi:hypothetical protein
MVTDEPIHIALGVALATIEDPFNKYEMTTCPAPELLPLVKESAENNELLAHDDPPPPPPLPPPVPVIPPPPP